MKTLLARKGMFFTGLMAVFALVGCATSAPHAKFIQPMTPAAVIRTNDVITIAVQPNSGVFMESFDRERLAQRIQEKLDTKRMLNAATSDSKNFAVEITVTKYDKGSAAARAMLAGLGQIHINGEIKIYTLPAREQVGDFTINKSFAWGGIYGASTTIEDAELGFAEGVADALTGQGDQSTSAAAKGAPKS